MSDSMLKMNSQVNQKLKAQAQEMGIKWKDATIKYDQKKGYSVAGYHDYKMKKAVDKGVEEGTLADRAKARRRRMDEAIDGKKKKQ